MKITLRLVIYFKVKKGPHTSLLKQHPIHKTRKMVSANFRHQYRITPRNLTILHYKKFLNKNPTKHLFTSEQKTKPIKINATKMQKKITVEFLPLKNL